MSHVDFKKWSLINVTNEKKTVTSVGRLIHTNALSDCLCQHFITGCGTGVKKHPKNRDIFLEIGTW